MQISVKLLSPPQHNKRNFKQTTKIKLFLYNMLLPNSKVNESLLEKARDGSLVVVVGQDTDL